MSSSKPENKIQAVKYLASLEKLGVKIKCAEGSKNWRMLRLIDLIKLSRRMWDKYNLISGVTPEKKQIDGEIK